MYERCYRTFASIATEGPKRGDKTEVRVRIFWRQTRFLQGERQKEFTKALLSIMSAGCFLLFFSKKYNLFVAFPRTSRGNLIH